MDKSNIILICLLFSGFAFGPCYQHKSSSGNTRKVPEDRSNKKTPPRPFQFSYSLKNRNGSTIYHEAQGDHTGKVSGTYGYSLANGLYRKVIYVADASGYRPVIQTNEPGTANKNPADVVMDVKPVPEVVSRTATQSGGQNAFDIQRTITGSRKSSNAGVSTNNTGGIYPRTYGGYGAPVSPRE